MEEFIHINRTEDGKFYEVRVPFDLKNKLMMMSYVITEDSWVLCDEKMTAELELRYAEEEIKQKNS